MGRPSSLTPETVAKYTAALLGGNSASNSARLAGVSRETVRKWKLRGETGEEPYAGFVVTLKAAEAEAEAEMVALVRKAAIVSWQAGAWWLERRCPAWRSPDLRAKVKAGAVLAPNPAPTAPQDRLELVKRLRAAVEAEEKALLVELGAPH